MKRFAFALLLPTVVLSARGASGVQPPNGPPIVQPVPGGSGDPTSGGSPGGDGPCYETAKKNYDKCCKAAKTYQCYLLYCAETAACDAQGE